jgi:hypothetical protein
MTKNTLSSEAKQQGLELTRVLHEVVLYGIKDQTRMSVSCNIINQQEAEILKSSSGWCVQMTEKQVLFIAEGVQRGRSCHHTSRQC